MVIRSGTSRARELRRDQTRAEAKLWSKLRNRQLDGFKFRRQFPIQGYFVDFVCIDAKLVVELDGGQHADQADYDAKRSEMLERYGFQVIRFWNHQVLYETEGTMEIIQRALHAGSY